jgi:hypothetical protein
MRLSWRRRDQPSIRQQEEGDGQAGSVHYDRLVGAVVAQARPMVEALFKAARPISGESEQSSRPVDEELLGGCWVG